MSCHKGCCIDQRTHYRSINIGGFPTPDTYAERRLSKDMDAFKRLTQDGLQPPRIDGCAAIEANAVTPREVEAGQAIDPVTHSLLEEAGI